MRKRRLLLSQSFEEAFAKAKAISLPDGEYTATFTSAENGKTAKAGHAAILVTFTITHDSSEKTAILQLPLTAAAADLVYAATDLLHVASYKDLPTKEPGQKVRALVMRNRVETIKKP